MMGAYAQNLMLLLHEQGIGTCWKTPPTFLNQKFVRYLAFMEMKSLQVSLYLTDLEEVPPKAPRKTNI